MTADLAARALRRPTRWAGALLFHALAAALDCGPCADLEGYPLLPHGLLEEHVDRLGRAYAELGEELRRVVPRLPLHAYGDVDRLHADLPASCVRNTAIVRAAGDMFLESVTWRPECALTPSHTQRQHPWCSAPWVLSRLSCTYVAHIPVIPTHIEHSFMQRTLLYRVFPRLSEFMQLSN